MHSRKAILVVCTAAAICGVGLACRHPSPRGTPGGSAAAIDRTPPPVVRLQTHDFVHGATFSPDGRLLAVTAFDWDSGHSDVRVYDSATGKAVRYLSREGHAEHPVSLVGGRTFAVALQDDVPDPPSERIEYWDWGTLKRVRVLQIPPLRGERRRVEDISRDGARAVVAAQDARIYEGDMEAAVGARLCLWDIKAAVSVVDLPLAPPDARSLAIDDIAISPDGRYVAAGLWSRALVGPADPAGGYVLYDTYSRRCVLRDIRVGGARGFAFSRDGVTLAVPLHDGVELWRVSDGRRIGTARWRYGVGEAAFSPDGSLLAVVAGQEIGLWDVRLKRWKKQWLGGPYTEGVRCLTFSPDGTTLLAAGSPDKGLAAARIWRVRQ